MRNIFLSIIVLFLSMHSLAQETLVFIGNTAVGKSAVVNALIGENVAPSGLSLGEPLTNDIGFYSHGDKLFIDTPPIMLDDNEAIAVLHAKSIGLALGKPGTYRIFFVLAFGSNGTVSSSDKRMIDLVLKNLPFEAKYNFIFNRVTSKMRAIATPKLGLVQKEFPNLGNIILIDDVFAGNTKDFETAYKEDFIIPFPDEIESAILKKSAVQTFKEIVYAKGKLLLK